MPVTDRALNRATLERQSLLRRADVDVVEAVGSVGALQAQEPASPYLALWNRIEGFEAGDLDRAFADGSVLKGSLMRLTLHAVAAADFGPFRAATEPLLRAAAYNDKRYRETGLTIEQGDELAERIREATAEPCTREDLVGLLTEAIGGEPPAGVWRAIRYVAPIVHAPTGGPWSFERTPAFAAAPDMEARPDAAAGLRHLVTSYLAAFGPASVADICQFTLQRRPPVREAIDALGDELVRLEDERGTALIDLAGATLPTAETTAPPRLLPMWDSTLLAYDDRSRIIPEAHRSHVIRRNGDCLATVLVDGWVRGVWRPVEAGIEITPLEPIDERDWAGIEAEAAALRAFLAGRDPAVYARFDRWWDRLPNDGRRVVG
ncbi:MAG: winged helix DNA-binding domain-containing protein [Actinomycetota bacterium]